jgi:hypothetical protein
MDVYGSDQPLLELKIFCAFTKQATSMRSTALNLPPSLLPSIPGKIISALLFTPQHSLKKLLPPYLIPNRDILECWQKVSLVFARKASNLPLEATALPEIFKGLTNL